MGNKKRNFGIVPNHVFEAMLDQWTANAATLAAMYPEDEKFDSAMEGLMRVFDILLAAHRDREYVVLLAAVQHNLPDYETDDSGYADDVPF